jgi:hypothetical protein
MLIFISEFFGFVLLVVLFLNLNARTLYIDRVNRLDLALSIVGKGTFKREVVKGIKKEIDEIPENSDYSMVSIRTGSHGRIWFLPAGDTKYLSAYAGLKSTDELKTKLTKTAIRLSKREKEKCLATE